MGQSKSTEEKINEERQMINNQMSSKDFPDVGIDKALLQFTGLRSLEKLNEHYKKRERGLNENATAWIKDLAEKLLGLIPIPDAAGLGSLVIAIVIDRSVAAIEPPEDSTDDLLHRIFAEEKASAVRDQMDEYLKRHLMHIRNKPELMSDIKHMERNLSLALTQLKNSMLLDGQMSSRALRMWVNGAAFHVQMLIHLARLDEARDSGPVRSVITTYQSNLENLLSEYKEYKKSTVRFRTGRDTNGFTDCYYVFDDETKSNVIISNKFGPSEVKEAYLSCMLPNHKKIRKMQQHFSEVKENADDLISQTSSFIVPQ